MSLTKNSTTMKTLKYLVLFCLLLIMVGKAYSQPVRTEQTVRIAFFIPCVNETISGYVITERVAWSNIKEGCPHPISKVQLKYDDVVLYGSRTKLAYTLNFVSQTGYAGEGNGGESADVNHFVRMVTVRLDGKLIALLPIHVQKVLTPDDEIVVNINDNDVRCFD